MPHRSAIEAITDAVMNALNVTAMTTLATGGVFNYKPASPTYPYVRVGDPSERRLDVMQRAGKECTIQVHVHSTSADDRQSAQIISKAVELLHEQPLTVSGHTLVGVQYATGYDAGPQLVGSTEVKHFVGVFRIQVQQN
jgi:hypothetical protein